MTKGEMPRRRKMLAFLCFQAHGADKSSFVRLYSRIRIRCTGMLQMTPEPEQATAASDRQPQRRLSLACTMCRGRAPAVDRESAGLGGGSVGALGVVVDIVWTPHCLSSRMRDPCERFCLEHKKASIFLLRLSPFVKKPRSCEKSCSISVNFSAPY